MIVEERDYLLTPGSAARYLDAWHRLGREHQVRHLGDPLGVFTVDIGDVNTLVYLWVFDDLSDRARRRAALAADDGFAAFRRDVKGLLLRQTNRILLPAVELRRPDEPGRGGPP